VAMKNIVYFDLETQKSATDVGGWDHKPDMLMSIGVTFSTGDGQYRIYNEAQVKDLITQLRRADLVIGFNLINFDYDVLSHYTLFDFQEVPTLDLMKDLEATLGHRLSLESLAVPTLGAPKVANGLTALQWWKEGRIVEIAEYCCFDVKITKELHEYGQAHGEVFYTDRYSQKRSVKVKW